MGRYSQHEIDGFAEQVIQESLAVLPGHFDPDVLSGWNEALGPLLDRHISNEGQLQNRGSSRYYVTLPFRAPFADPGIFEDDDILAVVERLVGEHPVMCQLASDTPFLGSDYQEVHRDAPPLFPEWGRETPPFQLAVNFPLCDVTLENGPLEYAPRTHMISKEEGLRRLETGEARLEPLVMTLGDVMIRDVRHLHRGTPNRTAIPRPMVVIGYSRRWQLRPEVSIQVPRAALATLSDRARDLLRFNPVVDQLDENAGERYQAFAY
jgi:ectoine hydroxylase-related dioxygenase (phytanoyl-CoA dioxygenase family)